MKKAKRFFSFALSVLLFIGMMCAAAPAACAAEVVDSGECGEHLTYKTYSDRRLVIEGTGPMYDFELVSVSGETYSTAPWTGYRSEITSVVIGNSVTTVGKNAFFVFENLKTVSIGSGVKRIEESAFASCGSLTSVTIPESVTFLGTRAFYWCKALKTISFPKNLLDVGADVFSDTPWFESQPEGIVYIGCVACGIKGDFPAGYSLSLKKDCVSLADRLFKNCSALKTATIPKNVTHVGRGVFCFCNNLTSVSVEKGNPVYYSAGNCVIETASKTLVVGCVKSVIPSDGSVTAIGDGAFYGIYTESVSIPSCVTKIGNYAFAENYKLSSLKLPERLTEIGDYAFYQSQSLKSLSIPSGVKKIGSYAFACNYRIQSVKLPEGLVELGEYAFYDCDNLTTVVLPGSLEEISEHAFAYCTHLSSVTIPEGVTTIDAYAFHLCCELESIALPRTIIYIGYKAFANSSRLKTVSAPIFTPFYIEEDAFLYTRLGSDTNGVCYIGSIAYGYFGLRPADCRITLRADCVGIAGGAFSGIVWVKEIVMPRCTYYIGSAAFKDCNNLKSITIGPGLEYIFPYALNGCYALSEINYKGTQEEWEQYDIYIYEKNSAFSVDKVRFIDPLSLLHDTGDVDGNGTIEPADARLALRISLGLYSDEGKDITEEDVYAADVNGSGGVEPADARLILRKSLGLEVEIWVE